MQVPETHFVNGHRIQPPFPDGMQRALFALGCFWGAEKTFWQLPGVYSTAVGYAGGHTPDPSYKQVCGGSTGHAESVLVVFDPKKIDYEDLLRTFWESHDPTQGMRQGNDIGTQYRSAIFYTNPDQERLAKAYIAQLDAQKVFPKQIVTQVTPLKGFYRAEDYHQDYAYYNPNDRYIEVCDRPKIAALKEQFPELFADYKPAKKK